MTYVVIKNEYPTSNLDEEFGKAKFVYKSDLKADLGQSFGRFFVSLWDRATPPKPIMFGDWMHINDMFPDSLWGNVYIQDINNNIEIQSSNQSHLQSIAYDLLQPDNNNVAGITSNSNTTVNPTNNEPAVLVNTFNHLNAPLDVSIGHNFDDLHQHTYARWGETLKPFPLPTNPAIVSPGVGNKLIMTMKNKAGLTRLKRQFLFGNTDENADVPCVNSIPYVYKPHWCDIFDGKKQYWTNDFNIELVRGNVLNSVQYQGNPTEERWTQPVVGDNSWLLGSKERGGVQIRFDSFEFIFYVMADPPRNVKRNYIWTTDFRSHLIDSSYYNKQNLITGNYDFTLQSIVKNRGLSTESVVPSEQCIYRSGLSLKLLNQAIHGSTGITQTDEPTMPLTDMTFFVNHGDEIVQIPSNERYNVFRYNKNIDDDITFASVDLLIPYMEYLKASGLNPFDMTNNRAKLDYNSFISQMLYFPVSLRKDRKYWSSEPQSVTSLGCEMNFVNTVFEQNSRNGIYYNLNIVGFRKVYV